MVDIVEQVKKIMKTPERIRNICTCAHIDRKAS